jgi:transcriptional regulator
VAWGSVEEDAMYLPKQHEVTDLRRLHDLIQAHPFATWVTLDEGRLVANHLPFLLETSGERGTLIGHVARANPVWRSTGTPSLVIFQGAQGYITPSWYPAKAEHGRVVPTWNYTVVHARGVARPIEDRGWLRRHVSRLVDVHEAAEATPWKVSDAPGDYIDAMLKAIVGIEIPIDGLVGTWKVSQNRSLADRRGVSRGLTARRGEESADMARLVVESGPEPPTS